MLDDELYVNAVWAPASFATSRVAKTERQSAAFGRRDRIFMVFLEVVMGLLAEFQFRNSTVDEHK